MPPRSKSRTVDFVNCCICECTFSSRDQTIHEDLCREGINITDLTHGFIHMERLHGLLSTTEGTTQLPKSHKDHVVYLHPNAMKLCGLYIGSPVLVNHQVALYAWPNPTQPLTAVGMSTSLQTRLRVEERVVLSCLPLPYISAESMTWTPATTKPFMETEEFKLHLKQYHMRRFYSLGNVISFFYYGQPCELTLTNVTAQSSEGEKPAVLELTEHVSSLQLSETPGGDNEKQIDTAFYQIEPSSKMNIDTGKACKENKKRKGPSLSDVGGLESQIKMIQELIDLQLTQAKNTQKLGMSLPRGVLLYGPPGTGKSLLLQAVARDSDVHIVSLNGSDIWSSYYGETEGRLSSLFQEAKVESPSLVVIDEVDALCPRRGRSNNEVEKRVVASLLTCLDDVLSGEWAVMVIAATSKRDDLDPALRRPGRLDREVEIGVPTSHQRADILSRLLRKTPHTLREEDISSVADKAHGFVGADLTAVCKEGSMHAMRRCGASAASLSANDLLYGLTQVQPSAMREVSLEVPQVKWSDIGGQEDLKHKLRQAIEWPLKHPEAFTRLGITPPRGLLMYGPPGCSKTMIAKALARESGLNFISIKGPELFGKYVGESERAVREVFRKARSAAPAIIFFDEIDALAGERGSGAGGGGGDVSDRVLAQLLTEIDGVEVLQDVTIVAATNRPDRIDKALMRPGRLDRIVYVPLPDADTRREIFNIHFKKTPTGEDVDKERLVENTHGYSGAEVAAVCHEAALEAMQEDINIPCVSLRHFDQALSKVKPRVTQELMNFYTKYQESSGLHSI